MANTNILTNNHRYSGADLLRQQIEDANNTFYFFVGDSTIHANDDISDIALSVSESNYDVRQNLNFGKKLFANNVCIGIRNIPYTDNYIFDQYDDQIDLTDKDYYCVVNATSYSHVFKCLDNNNGSNSTVSPNFSDISGSNTQIYRLSDGYCWKYMYSVDNTTVSKFKTSEYFPCVANTSVTNSAIAGSINIIKINDGGKLYNNYTFGHFNISDISVGANLLVYQLSNSLSQSVNGYYTNCIVYMTSGTSVGQYKQITDHVANTSGNFIIIDSKFDTTPTNGDNYEIYPGVYLETDQTQTLNVVARALINANASNSVFRVEVLDLGKDYYSANAAVSANDVVGVALQANIVPIISPNGGHGYNPFNELAGRTLLISTTLANSEFNTIPTSNKFQQIGLIKNPLFANTQLTLSGLTTAFQAGEKAYYVNTTVASTNCTTNSQTYVVTGSNTTLFTYQFKSNDKIMLHDLNSNKTLLATVNNVVNNFSLNLTANCSFSSNDVVVYWSDIKEQIDVVDVISSSQILIANNRGTFTTGAQIIGETSGAYGLVSAVTRNDVSKYYDTFIQLNKININIVSGTFLPNETFKQANTTGTIHSSNSSVLYCFNLNKPITTGINIIGQTSGAIASVTKVYPKEIIKNSGEILYIENIESITRQPTQTETFKLAITY